MFEVGKSFWAIFNKIRGKILVFPKNIFSFSIFLLTEKVSSFLDHWVRNVKKNTTFTTKPERMSNFLTLCTDGVGAVVWQPLVGAVEWGHLVGVVV